MLTVDLPPDIETRLTILARSTGQPANHYVEEIFLRHLEELEEYFQDLEDLEIARKRMAEVEAGRSKLYTLAEMEKELALGR